MSCPLSFTFVPAERHAPCMRLTEAFQCSRQDIRSLSLSICPDERTDGVPKGRRESPPRRFFPGLAAGSPVRSVVRPAAGGARTSRRTPAALPPSLCRSFVRYPSSTLHSVGRAGRRGAERRAVGRTDEACRRKVVRYVVELLQYLTSAALLRHFITSHLILVFRNVLRSVQLCWSSFIGR